VRGKAISTSSRSSSPRAQRRWHADDAFPRVAAARSLAQSKADPRFEADIAAGHAVQPAKADQKASSDLNAITSINSAPGADDGLLANFASVLVRPDGHLAHVRPADTARRPHFSDCLN
jgi:hypothetical protein